MQTFSSELASSPHVKQATLGVLLRFLISRIFPLHLNMHIWPWCFSSQSHFLSSPMASLLGKDDAFVVFQIYKLLGCWQTLAIP